jgi:hypothetical protein
MEVSFLGVLIEVLISWAWDISSRYGHLPL